MAEVLEDVHDSHSVVSQAIGRAMQSDKGGKGVGEARLASAVQIEQARRRLERVEGGGSLTVSQGGDRGRFGRGGEGRGTWETRRGGWRGA